MIRDYWEKQFTCKDGLLQAFIGKGPCLDTPITYDEVKKAAKALKNNKATSHDKVYNPWFKNAGPKFWAKYAEITNNALETNTYPNVRRSYYHPLYPYPNLTSRVVGWVGGPDIHQSSPSMPIK